MISLRGADFGISREGEAQELTGGGLLRATRRLGGDAVGMQIVKSVIMNISKITKYLLA